MSDVYRFIGERIRELRRAFGERGISQDALADAMGTTANTISRWETAAYKPSADDLERLALFFGVSISSFFREADNSRLQALLSATGDLHDDDFEELIHYAQFRKARTKLRSARKGKK
jgi:transcriptional regulator with XRE-family HTH domain